MIQRDPMKALVELVTNSDDSYARLEERGVAVTGRIEVSIEEHRGARPSVLRVRDDAEGFDLVGLDTKVGRMGDATSGLAQGSSVRGVWGDGLKEAALGLGLGATVTSIRDGILVQCRLAWSDDREPMYTLCDDPRPATSEDRVALDLAANGTVIEVEVAPGISVPRHDGLVRDIGLHFALRDIVRSPRRRLLVRRVGRTHEEDRAYFRDPLSSGAPAIEERATVSGYPDAEVELSMWVAALPLSGAEDGPYRTGGLLIQSRRALLDCSFFGLDGRVGTERLWGRVRCNSLYDRLAAGEPVLARNRTGLARENPFVRALLGTIDALVAPHLQRIAAVPSVPDVDDPASQLRFGDVLRELNRILVVELRSPREVSSGVLPFHFTYRRYRIGSSERVARLHIRPGILRTGDVVSFAVDGDAFELSGPAQVTVLDSDDEEGLVIATSVRAGQPVAQGTLRARCGALEATARLVSVSDLPNLPLFGFDVSRHRIRVARWTPVWLVSRGIVATRNVDLTADGGLDVRPTRVMLDGEGPQLHAQVEVRGMQVGATGHVFAHAGELQDECAISVVARREDTQVERGPIAEIHLDNTPFPERRVAVRESDGSIVIYVNDPSISAYLAESEDRDSPAGRTMIAELVLEAFCTHVALRKVDEEPGGDPARVVLAHIDRLQHAYGALVHRVLGAA